MHPLTQALDLASKSLNLTSPNPRVGCVIVDPQGKTVGQGHTQRAGGPHAEIMALRDAQSQGVPVSGCTAFVTLEPCCHHGRTGPCCDALITAGISRVVATQADPNPLVAGQGFARLRAAGVEVEVLATDDPLALRSRELNIGFFSRMIRKKPWVRMKIAASLDGKTALPNGLSQWITSAEARADGHAWRARACAVLTGIGTVLADDPKLDVRLVHTDRQPGIVLVDSHMKTPHNASILKAQRPIWICASGINDEKSSYFESRGAKIMQFPDEHGQVDLAAMLGSMIEYELNEIHVEAGQTLNGALIRAGLVDEFLIYLAPTMLGLGADMARFGPLDRLSDAMKLEFQSVDRVGPDLRVLARVAGHDRFLTA
jgi:diaminohydroxyphosphoribosylaminopyrimidine deaminase/5-amino-6-(5-phosphoribosylamino)uracil reductase